MTASRKISPIVLLTLVVIYCSSTLGTEAIQYDLVFTGGRVVDPESGFDQIANVAISGGRIGAISELPLTGIETIDASGLIVSPGFIDLHSHALSKLGQRFQAMDGVTTALELEAGVYPMDALAQMLGGKAVINYGASTGHLPIRQLVIEKIRKPHLLIPAEQVLPETDVQVQPNAALSRRRPSSSANQYGSI